MLAATRMMAVTVVRSNIRGMFSAVTCFMCVLACDYMVIKSNRGLLHITQSDTVISCFLLS